MALPQFPHISALARDYPCEMYLDHGSARPAVTQGHHGKPEYLQRRLWGEVRDHSVIWLCGTCHDNLHAYLYWLMGERRTEPVNCPPRAVAWARSVLAWYDAELRAAETNEGRLQP